MKQWLRRIRGAVGTGLIWAFGWAVAGVLLIGVPSKLLPFLPWHYFFDVFDAPLPAMAVPGFFGGVFFSIVLGIAGRRHRFRDLSLARFAAWGAVGALLLMLFPFALVAVGLASTQGSSVGAATAIAVVAPVFILFSAASASGSLMLARRGEDQDPLVSDADPAEAGLGQGAARDVLGSGDLSLRNHPAAPTEERARARAKRL